MFQGHVWWRSCGQIFRINLLTSMTTTPYPNTSITVTHNHQGEPCNHIIVKLNVGSIFTVHNSSCGKVLFLHLSVILFTGGRGVFGQTPTPLGRHPLHGQTPPRQTIPPPPNGRCSGWYASYWNAFLCEIYVRNIAFPLFSIF